MVDDTCGPQPRRTCLPYGAVMNSSEIQVTGDKAAPGLWMSFAAVCGLGATLFLYRRRPEGAAAPTVKATA